jgi:signal transduction histidine kinase
VLSDTNKLPLSGQEDQTRRLNIYKEYIKITAPAIAAVVLFALAMFGVFLPGYQASLMDGKKEMIREITSVAWNILETFAQKEGNGELSRKEAQQKAMEQIRRIRYGPEKKDYLWINDMQPVMIMHPYRTDLAGKDLSSYTDSEGNRFFLDIVDNVKNNGEGYVRYTWQWKNKPEIVTPKLSFVKGFAPWGWIIGTGIYLEDVNLEIIRLTRRLALSTLAILAVVIGVASLLVVQAIRAARLRHEAEEKLLAYQEQLEEQVRERTKGLKQALEQIKTLRGIIPICSYCKQIRDDKGYWSQVEQYVSEHSEAEFSHGICPRCMREHFPETAKKLLKKKE